MLIEEERLCNDPRGISGRSLNVTLFSFAVFFFFCDLSADENTPSDKELSTVMGPTGTIWGKRK